MAIFKVKKRNGNLEDFNRNKVLASCIHAGATPNEAEQVTVKVELWAPTVAMDGIINSDEIRTRVIDLLKEVDEEAGAKYAAYRK